MLLLCVVYIIFKVILNLYFRKTGTLINELRASLTKMLCKLVMKYHLYFVVKSPIIEMEMSFTLLCENFRVVFLVPRKSNHDNAGKVRDVSKHSGTKPRTVQDHSRLTHLGRASIAELQ